MCMLVRQCTQIIEAFLIVRSEVSVQLTPGSTIHNLFIHHIPATNHTQKLKQTGDVNEAKLVLNQHEHRFDLE